MINIIQAGASEAAFRLADKRIIQREESCPGRNLLQETGGPLSASESAP